MSDLDLDAIRRRLDRACAFVSEQAPDGVRDIHKTRRAAYIVVVNDVPALIDYAIEGRDLCLRSAERITELLAEVERLKALTATCTCYDGNPANYDGPQADCAIHGAIRAFNDASREIKQLMKQGLEIDEENLRLREQVERLKASQLPDGGMWDEQRGWAQQDGRFIEAATGGLVRQPTHRRRVWTGQPEPIPSQSDSEPRSEVDPHNDTQTPHTAV